MSFGGDELNNYVSSQNNQANTQLPFTNPQQNNQLAFSSALQPSNSSNQQHQPQTQFNHLYNQQQTT
jgi:hypothetical protein